MTYADDDWSNTNTSAHPGEGFALPVDARSAAMTRRGVNEPGTNRFWNFAPWTPTLQVFDATFGIDPTDSVVFPFVGILPPLPGSPAGIRIAASSSRAKFPPGPPSRSSMTCSITGTQRSRRRA